MAIYHLQVLPVRRGLGGSATATAASRSGTEILDARTGQLFDHRGKTGVVHAEIVLASSVAHHETRWARQRSTLWNAAELAEARHDARVAREYRVALPHELEPDQRLELAREFSAFLVERYECAIDLTLHAAKQEGDARNAHAVLLSTTRQIAATGLGNKTHIEWSNSDRKKLGLVEASGELVLVRERWASLTNLALQRYGHDARVDHRTIATQRKEALAQEDFDRADELDRQPTRHLGGQATAMERRGKSTYLGDANRLIAEQAQARLLQRELQVLDAAIAQNKKALDAAQQEIEQMRNSL